MKKEKKNIKLKKKYPQEYKGRNSSRNVELRQQEFIRLLGSGLTLQQISKILNVSMDTLYKDKQAISKKGLDNLRNLGNAELTFYYASLISDMNDIKRYLWNLIHSTKEDNQENQSDIKKTGYTDNTQLVSIDHKLKASRTLMEINREFRELYKDTVNAIIIPDYTKRLERIESLLLNEDNKQQDTNSNNTDNKDNKLKSFMNQKRPSLSKDYKDNTVNHNNTVNNNDNDNNSNIDNGM